MKTGGLKIAAFVFLLVACTPSIFLVYGTQGLDIEDRIAEGIGWIIGQETMWSGVTGYRRSPVPGEESVQMYSEDHGLVALMLSAYRDTHFTDRFDQRLRVAVEFLIGAQTLGKDFYHFFDGRWRESGKLYSWNAYAILGLAHAAYIMTKDVPAERAYWNRAEIVAREALLQWMPRSQRLDGAWMFSYVGASDRTGIGENGAMLAATLYTALYEKLWGSPAIATLLTGSAHRAAKWLYEQQERDSSSWGYGGFYHNVTRSGQQMGENSLAMFGLNRFWKIMGALLDSFTPTYEMLRQSMRSWVDGFVERMVDAQWGLYSARSALGLAAYPKTSFAAGWTMQTLADIWINMGDAKFWDDAHSLYKWLTGNNEMRTDLQQAPNSKDQPGGFYEGIITTNSLNTASSVATTASVVFGLLYGSLIRIPEFSSNQIALIGTMLIGACLLTHRIRGLRRDRIR